MARHKNVNCDFPDKLEHWDQVKIVMLMDIRDDIQDMVRELRTITRLRRFIEIPSILARIERNTKRRRKRKSK